MYRINTLEKINIYLPGILPPPALYHGSIKTQGDLPIFCHKVHLVGQESRISSQICKTKRNLRVSSHRVYLQSEWLIEWCLMLFSTVFQLFCGSQFIYPCFPGVLLTSIPHNVLSKPLAAFPHNHCWNNGQQWERYESCCNNYHKSSERILTKPGIKPVTRSQVCNTTDWAMEFSPHSEDAVSKNERNQETGSTWLADLKLVSSRCELWWLTKIVYHIRKCPKLNQVGKLEEDDWQTLIRYKTCRTLLKVPHQVSRECSPWFLRNMRRTRCVCETLILPSPPPFFPKNVLWKGECKTILSAYTINRHLG